MKEIKRLNEAFSEREYQRLKRAKEKTGLTWHDFIMTLSEEEMK